MPSEADKAAGGRADSDECITLGRNDQYPQALPTKKRKKRRPKNVR